MLHPSPDDLTSLLYTLELPVFTGFAILLPESEWRHAVIILKNLAEITVAAKAAGITDI